MGPLDGVITIPMLILFIIGGSVVVHSTFNRYFGDSIIPLVIYLGIMAAAFAIGFWASYKGWKNDKGWMLKKIREMKRNSGYKKRPFQLNRNSLLIRGKVLFY